MNSNNGPQSAQHAANTINQLLRKMTNKLSLMSWTFTYATLSRQTKVQEVDVS